MAHDKLIVRGAREHNLKNITVEIPRDKLVVITGLSGSGKSSLAFDTIYAEGQRRYVESLSAYARQFLGLMEKPDVDQIEGLSPAISIDQKGTSRNPRSTVGTVTEVYDYLRLLFARIGQAHCPQCGRLISRQTPQQIVDAIAEYPENSRLLILAPLVKDRKGEHKNVFEDVRKAGFVRVRVDGEVHDVNDEIELDRYKVHSIEAVVDRVIVRRGENGQESLDLTRLTDSVETALALGGGVMTVADVSDSDLPDSTGSRLRLFSEHLSCAACGISLPAIEPRTFSFNSPHGACPTCSGLGTQMEFDPDLIAPDPELSLADGALHPWSRDTATYYQALVEAACKHYGIPTHAPWQQLSRKQQEIILYGGKRGDTIKVRYVNQQGQQRQYETSYEGIIPNLQRRYRETTSEYIRGEFLERYMTNRPCPTCQGKRLRPEALAVTVHGLNIEEVTRMAVSEALDWVRALRGSSQEAHDSASLPEEVPAASPLSQREWIIARQVLKEIQARLRFMFDVGLDYITLNRQAGTLSGGEAQRIRLATQIGSQLMGVLYILDEPSIGLHQRDNARLIRTLYDLRDLGNTVLVVEHDEETMQAADWLIDLGPGAGEHGGEVVAAGTPAEVANDQASLTGAFLSRRRSIPIPAARRIGSGKELILRGASANNLRRLDVRIPLGRFVVVTGVSGSGKSTLVIDTLYHALAQRLYRARQKPGPFETLEGLEHLDKVIDIDQSPIGRTPRSNPATYTDLFTPIRKLFANLPEAKVRGYTPGRFSFNVKGGRCEACQGDGILRIEMQFLPDVYVPCEVCQGKRYNREALEVVYKGKSIADVLDMTVEEALDFFANISSIHSRLQTLHRVGLSYIRLGQPATTLSGGEAQRVKLSKELSRRATGNTLYILDEPTTGLHFADVEKLLHVLHDLVDRGNTVLVIEHNLDVIKAADWVIDMGPEGGGKGGKIVVEGTPEQVAAHPRSYTGQFLYKALHSF
ncbi:MAG: excinuclease ABC subunit UvrA [Caldilineales bacterium]|nr:excinuclease ABC subunit UvrA [Caldilineales bacterium]